MARAQLNKKWQDSSDIAADSDWQALRSDLLSLLGQVENRVADETMANPDPEQIARSAPRTQTRQSPKPEKNGAQPRHHEALQSVARTLSRVSERDQHTIDTAIEEIRDRHADIPKRRLGRVDDINDTVSSMAARLEQIGTNLRDGDPSPAGFNEISDQLGQLTYVVELLAGAVGETGQVKRLEAQIADIARLIGDAQKTGEGDIGARIESLLDQVRRLGDLQQQQADRPIAHLEELAVNQDNGLKSIENGVRSVYDRIDAIEQSLSGNPSDLGRLTDEIAAVSQEMANVSQLVKAGNGSSNTLLDRVDALNARVGQIEDRGSLDAVGGLQADVETLRDAIKGALEPRFKDIANQINSLGQIPASPGGEGLTASALEAQIRQLIARMDQTGEQLTDIKQLYSKSAMQAGSGDTPDMDALAELVATRASAAISRNIPAPAKAEIGMDSLAALEKRMTQMFADQGSGHDQSNAEEFAGVYEGIKQVDARLKSLEATLNGSLVQKAAPNEVLPSAPDVPVSKPASAQAAPAPFDDSMQTNPADDMPLIDPGFAPDTAAVQPPSAATPIPQPRDHPEARVNPRPDPSTHTFDPNSVERPSKPRSSLAPDVDPSFAGSPTTEAPRAAPMDRAGATNVGRNTFIEAARRAAQRQEELEPAASQSLIARALARFQNDTSSPQPDPSADIKTDARTERQERAALKAEAKAAKKAEKAAKRDNADAAQVGVDPTDATYEAKSGSFFSRHWRTLLLGAAVITISLLALNLVNQRLNNNAATTSETIGTETVPEADVPAPAAAVDPEATGSIDSMVRMVREQPSPVGQDLPDVLKQSLAGLPDNFTTGALPEATDSLSTPEPIPMALKLDLPPESIGPLALRQAAADGDARAQFEIAAIYGEGQATEQDFAESAKWYERSAAQGFVPAEYRLGSLYEHGKGVEKDLMQAKLWYQRAAEAGNRMSMHNLAALYASGELGTQEFSMAAEWFERAAVRGLTDSQFNLGMLYARGLGVPQNMPESFKWFSLAAAQGDDGAVTARDDIARSLDAETVNRLQTEIGSWQRTPIDIAANFAPIGTWTEDFNPGQTITDKNVIEKVQAALNRLGYDVGVPDGLMGPRTREAIKEFEKATGMSEVGAINPRLLAVLGSQPV